MPSPINGDAACDSWLTYINCCTNSPRYASLPIFSAFRDAEAPGLREETGDCHGIHDFEAQGCFRALLQYHEGAEAVLSFSIDLLAASSELRRGR